MCFKFDSTRLSVAEVLWVLFFFTIKVCVKSCKRGATHWLYLNVFPPVIFRSLREGAAGSGQKEVEEKEDVGEKEDAEPVLQRVLRL